MPVTIQGDRLIRYEDAAVHFAVPQHVKYIEELAFSGADRLVSLEIPDGVERIGNYAFRMCYNLREIRLPAKVDMIGAGLFQHCWKLKRIALPEGTLMIGGEMFESCHALEELMIPGTVVKIDRSAFSGCRSLTRIVIDPERLKILPPAARYSAVLTYMEKNWDQEGNSVIDEFAAERQGNLLDLAINRRNAQAVRYMLGHGLIGADALADHIEKSADRNRVEITALMLEYGHNIKNDRDPFDEDPFK